MPNRRIGAVITIMVPLALTPLMATRATAPSDIQAVPRRAPKLVLESAAPAPAADPIVMRRVTLPRLDDAVRRRMVLDAGMPAAFSLTSEPITLTARRMIVDNAARLDTKNGQFSTSPAYDHFVVDTAGKALDIHFNVAKPKTLVLIVVRGWAAHPNRNTPPSLLVPASGKTLDGQMGALVPFVLECHQAGWHQVSLSLRNLDISGLGLSGPSNFYVVRSVDLSTYS